MTQDELKTLVGQAALQYVTPGDIVGVGTGSTVNFFIDALANGAKYGSAEIPQITDALLKFGAVAKSSNVSIGESTALIELLAEKVSRAAYLLEICTQKMRSIESDIQQIIGSA